MQFAFTLYMLHLTYIFFRYKVLFSIVNNDKSFQSNQVFTSANQLAILTILQNTISTDIQTFISVNQYTFLNIPKNTDELWRIFAEHIMKFNQNLIIKRSNLLWTLITVFKLQISIAVIKGSKIPMSCFTGTED